MTQPGRTLDRALNDACGRLGAMQVPRVVLEAYGIVERSLEPVAIGLVNRTFLARTHARERVVLQRLHPAFSGAVNEDIDAITRHLARSGLVTPRLVRTRAGEAFVDAEGTYRVITYVPGITLSE